MKAHFCALTLVVSLFAIVPPATAAPSYEPDVRCRLSTLEGEYLYVQDGFTVAGTEAAQRMPFAQAGREVYDGRGNVTGTYSASINGSIVRGSYEGTYTLGIDCTGTVVFTDDRGQVFHYDIFALHGGDEFVFLQTDPGIVSASSERRRGGP